MSSHAVPSSSSKSNAVAVRHKLWALVPSAVRVRQFRNHSQSAIFWIPGDMPREKFADAAWNSRRLALWPKLAQRLANRYGVRVVRLSRLGLEGSSGDHARRGRPNEMHILNAAVDSLKQRFGIDDIAVVGQSRGSTMGRSKAA